MSVRIGGIAVVAKIATIAAAYDGGVVAYAAEASWGVTRDEALIAITCPDIAEGERWIARVAASGVTANELLLVDASKLEVPVPWLHARRDADGVELTLEAATAPLPRFEELSRSDSGLHYVRERRGGLMRVLTDSELADFNDPPPCPECAEQFGCEHFNVAREPLLTDAEVDDAVPREWLAFAKEYGVSRLDIERLQRIEQRDGEYRLTSGAPSDVRTLELVLLLNDAR